MTKIIFARTRYDYDSYIDYWSLVILSGFSVCYVDEIDFQDADALYIVSPINGEWRPHIDNHRQRKCKLAHWLLERPGGSGTLQRYVSDNRALVTSGYVDLNIVSDPDLARTTGFHYVPMGSHAELGEPGKEKDTDFVGLMSYSPRRNFLFRNPSFPRTRIRAMIFAPNASAATQGKLRDRILLRSRFGLNVHQDPFMFGEPLRFALFAAYGLPIISETIGKGHIYGEAMIERPIESILATCQGALIHYDRWAEWGLWLRRELTTVNSFRACLEKYL